MLGEKTHLSVLVLGYQVGHSASGGGSGRFMQCLADTLSDTGHHITTSTEPEEHVDKEYDLIICSHFLYRIEKNPAPKIYVSHGIVNNERLYRGADKYVSISPEAKAHNLKYGVYSEIINQPIFIREKETPGDELKKILVIRRGEVERDPFAFLSEKYELRISDFDIPIEKQISWADLCITLGRGALESMAQGKPVLVADCRDYIGAVGDGYVNADNLHEIAKNNFSGRRYKIPLSPEWIESELAKYNPADSDFLHKYVSENHEAGEIAGQYLDMVKPILKLGDNEIIGSGSFTLNVGGQEGPLSIIIPVFNQHEISIDCIQAVMETTENYEVIVIDNGSNPPFKPPFAGFNEIRVIRNYENKGFPIAVNQGIREANGETIVLLNNDCIVTPGALNNLDAWLDTFDIVGPTSNYCAGVQRVELPVYHTREGLDDEAGNLFEDAEGQGQPVNWIIGFCMAFKKSLYNEIGPFDESLWPCSGEEIDFCLNARAAGYTVGIAHDTYVHHEGSKTFDDLEMSGDLNYQNICNRNHKHLAEKWGKDFWDEQEIKENRNAKSD
jgi:GT2 family glycosyltransferase